MSSELSPAQPTHRRLGGILESYVRNKLTRDGHPALKVIRDRDEALYTSTQAPLDDDTQLILAQDNNERPEINKKDPINEEELSLEEIYREAENEKRQFELAMQGYEKTTAGSKFKTDVSSSSMHTWEEVLEEVNKAAERYNNTPGLWGKVKKGFHSFGKNHKAFTAWSCLLPSQSEYFSILCGGLKLIIGAAARMHDLREDICAALAEIPMLLRSTHRALAIFKQSKDLQQCSSALYVSTIATLHHIVSWYTEKAYSKLIKSLFKQDVYGDKLKEMIKTTRERSKQFDKSVQQCSYELSFNTNQEVKSHRMEASTNQSVLVGLLNEVVRLLESNPRMDPNTHDLRVPIPSLRKAVSETSLLRDRSQAKAKLLEDFYYESSIVQHDIESALRGVWTLPKPDQDRTVYIIRSPKLHQWITRPASSGLFINMNCKGNMRQRSSFISAKLVDSIQPPKPRLRRDRSSVCALSFFCGEHRRRSDPDSGIGGMMRSLISQLLLLYPDFDIKTMDTIRNFDYDSGEDLCEILYILVSELPPHMVIFCIIDSISYFEEDEMQCEESELVVQQLMDIVENTQESGCTFKVLFTSPWNSRVLYKHMPSEARDVLWVPSGVPSQGGFTSMKWSDSIGSDLGLLTPG